MLKDYCHNDKDPIITIIKELLTINGGTELLKYDVNAKNNLDNTPFHYINEGTFHPNKCLIKLFFEKGAKPNKKNKQKDTPFHHFNRAKLPKGDKGEYDPQLFRLFLENKANPNIQNKEGNTPYHDFIKSECSPDLIKLFLQHNAHGDIPDDNGVTPYELGLENANTEEGKENFRALHNKNRDWHYMKNRNYWREYQNNDLPDYIKKIFCYYTLTKPHNDFIQNNDENIITMITIHDTNEQENEAYYNPENVEFDGIMKFAENYITTYNEKKKLKNKLTKMKYLRLISFSWHNDLLHSAEQLTEYLDTKYRNSRLIFLAHGFGCDVANLTSHRLGVLQGEINEVIEERNTKIKNRNQKELYKGRIKLLLYLAPSCRLKIPEAAKSWFINFLGTEYDRLNDAISTKPTNYNLLLTFYSPDDNEIKPSAFNNEMKTLATRSISVGIGVGALTTYALCKDENKATTEGKKKLLLGVMVGGTILSYPLFVSHNKKKTIDNLPYHRYENVVPINEPTDDSLTIEGPKVHIKTMVDGRLIGHSAPELLQNLLIIFNILKTQYFTELTRSRSFCMNFNTNQNIQDMLFNYLQENEKKQHENDPRYEFNDDDDFEKIKNEFKFWANREDNCKVQCWFDDDYKSKVLEAHKSCYFYWARKNKKLRTNVKKSIDSTALEAQTEGTSEKHECLFEYMKTLRENYV